MQPRWFLRHVPPFIDAGDLQRLRRLDHDIRDWVNNDALDWDSDCIVGNPGVIAISDYTTACSNGGNSRDTALGKCRPNSEPNGCPLVQGGANRISSVHKSQFMHKI